MAVLYFKYICVYIILVSIYIRPVVMEHIAYVIGEKYF